jgi:hypothetical protein
MSGLPLCHRLEAPTFGCGFFVVSFLPFLVRSTRFSAPSRIMSATFEAQLQILSSMPIISSLIISDLRDFKSNHLRKSVIAFSAVRTAFLVRL